MKLLPLLLLPLFLSCAHRTQEAPIDHGFLTTDSGHPIRWATEDTPFVIMIHPSAAMWIFHFQKAAREWNKVLGRELFKVSPSLHPEAPAFLGWSPGIIPVFGFDPHPDCPNVADAVTCYPHTMVQAREEDGRMIGAPIGMPMIAALVVNPDSYLLVMHELGHVLGLAHDQTLPGQAPWSLMEPRLQFPVLEPPPVSSEDRERLLDWYYREDDEWTVTTSTSAT